MNTTAVIFCRNNVTLSLLFVCMQVLLYIDRGLIPGAHNEFLTFITHSSVCKKSPEVFFGILQVSFIAGLSLSSPLLSYVSTVYEAPILIVTIGWFTLLISACLAVIASLIKAVSLLFIARALSGVGEAAFVSLVAPLLMDAFPAEQKGVLLGVFYGAMPTGTALGFIIASSVVAKFNWRALYVFEVISCLPFLIILIAFCFDPRSHGISPFSHFSKAALEDDTCSITHTEVTTPISGSSIKRRHVRSKVITTPEKNNKDENDTTLISAEKENEVDAFLSCSNFTSSRKELYAISHTRTSSHTRISSHTSVLPMEDNNNRSSSIMTPPSFIDCIYRILRNPVFMAIVLTNSSHSAAVQSLATYGSAFLLNLGLFSKEWEASTTMGVMAAASGAIGTVLGGLVLKWLIKCLNVEFSDNTDNPQTYHHTIKDRNCRYKYLAPWSAFESNDQWNNRVEDMGKIMLGMLPFSISAAIVAMTVPIFNENRYIFLGLLTVSLLINFISQGAINLCVMLTVPYQFRGLVNSLNTFCLHVLGDVPGPVLIGKLKDILAPHCVYMEGPESSYLNCQDERRGVTMTIFTILSLMNFIWIGMAFVVYFCATRLKATVN